MSNISDEDLKKRLALQELFKNRIKNISLEKPEGYVSKLSPLLNQ